MRLFFLLIALFSSFNTIGQSFFSNRVEFDVKDDFYGFKLFKHQKNQLLVSSKKRVYNEYEWNFSIFDSALIQLSSVSTKLEDLYDENWVYKSDSNLFILAVNTKKGDFKLTTLDLKTMKFSNVKGALMKKIDFKEFIVLDGIAYLPAYNKKIGEFIQRIDPVSGIHDRILVEMEAKKELEYVDIELLDQTNEKEIWVKYKNCLRRTCDNYILPLQTIGENAVPFLIESQSGNDIINFSSTKLDDKSVLIAGTYSNDDKSSQTSEGMFFSKIENGKLAVNVFTPFLEMDNFLNYLSDKKKHRIEEKRKKKEKRGKELLLNYRVKVHDIIENDSSYLLVGEVYYSTYRTESYSERGQRFTRTVFDGYQYSHGVIVSYDKEGQKLWDQSIKMWLLDKPFYVKEHISIFTNGNRQKLIYLNSGRLKSFTLENGKIVSQKVQEKVETGVLGDRLKDSQSENTIHWFNNNFLSFGYQRIKNKENSKVSRNRNVFFINKLPY